VLSRELMDLDPVPEGQNGGSQAVYCLEYIRKSAPSRRDRTIVARYVVPGLGLKGGSSRRDGVILSVPVRWFRPNDAFGPIKSYRPAGTGRLLYASQAIDCLATFTSSSETTAYPSALQPVAEAETLCNNK
jgi:hypothetical protein